MFPNIRFNLKRILLQRSRGWPGKERRESNGCWVQGMGSRLCGNVDLSGLENSVEKFLRQEMRDPLSRWRQKQKSTQIFPRRA